MDYNKKNDDNKFFVNGKMYFHNITFPSITKSNVFTKISRIRLRTNIIIAVVGILSFLIMVLTKLKPIFITSWTQDFCVRWNDVWFTLSASLAAAIIFYFCFDYIPLIIKRRENKPFLAFGVAKINFHISQMMKYVIGIEFEENENLIKEYFVEKLINLDWEKEYTYFPSDKQSLQMCILRELEYVKTELNEVLSFYKDYLSNEERCILQEKILNHKIFVLLPVIVHEKKTLGTDDNSTYVKRNIASMFYDFVFTLYEFSDRLISRCNDYNLILDQVTKFDQDSHFPI